MASSDSESLSLDLPGFNMPLNFMPDEAKFWNVAKELIHRGNGRTRNRFYDWESPFTEPGLPLITLRELRMLQFMNQITDKPDWVVKVFDHDVASKWRNEALSSPEYMSEKMVDYCIAELRYKAKIYEGTGLISVFYGDVIKSDCAIPAWLQGELKALVAPLENIPARNLDWHPGSGQKVLDLVHPSLYPLVYGQTWILPEPKVTSVEDCISRCCEGVVLPIPPEEERFVADCNEPLFSRKFQWLPCDVDISSDDGVSDLRPRPATSDEEDEGPHREEGESENTFYYRRFQWMEEVREVVHPEPGEFVPPPVGVDDVDLRRDFGSSGLQIIVKLANIQLTPEEPLYDGGSWHIEGQLNEHICASALYYYDSANITSSYLAFRQRPSTVYAGYPYMRYPQNSSSWLKKVFGCENNGPEIQYVGKVDTREGHPTRPGHRKILALFLVDPNIRIISTANVPCQQKDWWTTEIQRAGVLAKLPFELQDQVFNEVKGFPISLKEAKEQRLELMEERKSFAFAHERGFEDSYFSLCEH
ncbi:hypothetical protein BS47DRAFT_1388453 [Hydnum rufescens UP504]|uniref:Uncharacterized protein n=1 Tax=Hydnum rufescens UP504 TaxID=1448309 RepID=A0A9P6B7M7_9AGAM|nr:hypothetical protein BS47DRAFT_1388453 [Hydnum rufescens UP504]